MTAPRRSAIRTAIDIGTNTVLALTARLGPTGEIVSLADDAAITRLGAGVDTSGLLASDAMKRTLSALEAFTQRARELGTEGISAVATSAVRDAGNRGEFLEAVKRIVGDDVAAITGEREARLTFEGAWQGTGIRAGEQLLVLDVGGGSTEVILGHAAGDIGMALSMPVGSVRLTERHVHKDPPRPDELQRIAQAVCSVLPNWPGAGEGVKLVGVAATVMSIATVARGTTWADSRKTHGHVLSLDEVTSVATKLAAMRARERAALTTLDPGRADVIVAGAWIVQTVMEWAGASSIVVSNGGVRVGLFLEQAHART